MPRQVLRRRHVQALRGALGELPDPDDAQGPGEALGALRADACYSKEGDKRRGPYGIVFPTKTVSSAERVPLRLLPSLE